LLNHHSNIKKHWHKLKFFSPQYGNQKPGDDIIIMDIDQIIVNNVDELLGWPVSENQLLSYGTIWNQLLKINGGFYKFKSGSLKCIWDDFAKNVEFWQLNYYRKGIVHSKYYGEQNYVNWKIQEHKIELITTPKQWFARYSEDYKKNISFKKEYSKCFNTEYMIQDDPHKYVRVVHFLGEGKTIHECNSNFVKKYWI
jgi:hypothetical protein